MTAAGRSPLRVATALVALGLVAPADSAPAAAALEAFRHDDNDSLRYAGAIAETRRLGADTPRSVALTLVDAALLRGWSPPTAANRTDCGPPTCCRANTGYQPR